jgi:hypothetical protein
MQGIVGQKVCIGHKALGKTDGCLPVNRLHGKSMTVLDQQKELLGFLGCLYEGSCAGSRKGMDYVQEHLRELEGEMSQMAQRLRKMEEKRQKFSHSYSKLPLPPSPG